jgi:hypothetical protein
VRADISEIDRRLADALRATKAALALTVLTFAAVLVFPAQPTAQATIDLTDEGIAAVDEVCEQSMTQVSGELQTDTLDDDFVVVEVPAGDCDPENSTVLRIPPKQVEAISSEARGLIPLPD